MYADFTQSHLSSSKIIEYMGLFQCLGRKGLYKQQVLFLKTNNRLKKERELCSTELVQTFRFSQRVKKVADIFL